MTRIVYNPQMQDANRLLIKEYLDKYEWLIPSWCQKFNVGLWDSGGEAIATMTVNYPYRFCTLEIYSCWLDRTPFEQENAILHELIHCHLAIMANYSRETFDNLCPVEEAPKFNQHLQEQLAGYHEAITVDLAYAIMSKGN